MKKKLAATLSVVLILGLAVLGILAYLTDTDSDVNVMTLGNVSIEQQEWQRADGESHINSGAQIGDLVPFEDYEGIYPAVPKNGAATDYSAEMDSSKCFHWGEYAPGWNGLLNDDNLSNVRDKIVMVKNTGKSDAYYRTLIAYECPEGITIGEPANGAEIMVNVNGNSRFDWENVGYITVDGTRYALWVANYNEVLTPGEVSRPSLLQVVLTHHATNEDVAKFGDNMEIMVLSQAVQAEGFANAETALDAAFGDVTISKAEEWFGNVPPTVKVEGNDKDAVVAAINEANPGDTVKLTEDVTFTGAVLTIDKEITLDLNGKTMTTDNGYGGIIAKGGCSIVNGTINHIGNTAAIKAFDVDTINNVTINVTQTSGKTKGGIVVQNNAGNHINSIKNVTINGATNGIECYHSTNEPAIGVMDNVKIDATSNGIYLNGAGIIGKISNCEIKGGNIGINAYLANLWHISLNIENSKISGGTTGIDVWDEAAVNTGSTVTLKYDDATTFTGPRENIKITLQEEIACTVNGEAQSTPCEIYK